MAAHPQPGKFVSTQSIKTLYSVGILVGLIVFVAGLIKDPQRIWFAFLVSFFYFLCLSMGGLFFTAIQHVTSAGWSVNIRRIPESFVSFLPIAGVAALVMLFGLNHLYEWTNLQEVAHDHILQAKQGYLNVPFFIVRVILFFAIWIYFGRKIVGNSVAQDLSGDENLTLKNLSTSVKFLLVFALSFSLFSVDFLMSLEPHWYSTIYGVYCFAGLFQSTIALMVIVTVYLSKKGLLRGLVSENHYHDLGKFMKGFTVFYAYIAFSQFILIWYANLPEETIFYLNRGQGMWLAISWSLLIFKFIVPFLLLLPKWAKRNPTQLVLVATIIMIMQYVDIYWLVYPTLDNSSVQFGWQEVGMFLGFMGLFAFSVSRFLENHNLVPIKDPRIEESIHHHVTY